MRRRRATFLAFFGATVTVLFACGARTGLLVPLEVAEDSGVDAGQDAGRDGFHARDVSIDQVPPIDSHMIPDVQRNCPDAAATLVYVVTVDNLLLSFNPPTAQFTEIGPIACPAASGSTPFSMAVDRNGIARVVFDDGELFRVSTASAACVPTPWIPEPMGSTFAQFGMAYVTDDTGGGETLFVAGNTTPAALGSIDANYILHDVGDFNPELFSAELTGTGDGRLFGFDSTVAGDPSSPSRLVQIDKNTAEVIGVTQLPGVQMVSTGNMGVGWAFGFWGGDFYFFTSPNGPGSSVVQRYRPSDGTISPVATLPNEIVGAGVSTCAPEL